MLGDVMGVVTVGTRRGSGNAKRSCQFPGDRDRSLGRAIGGAEMADAWSRAGTGVYRPPGPKCPQGGILAALKGI